MPGKPWYFQQKHFPFTNTVPLIVFFFCPYAPLVLSLFISTYLLLFIFCLGDSTRHFFPKYSFSPSLSHGFVQLSLLPGSPGVERWGAGHSLNTLNHWKVLLSERGLFPSNSCVLLLPLEVNWIYGSQHHAAVLMLTCYSLAGCDWREGWWQKQAAKNGERNIRNNLNEHLN